MTQQETDRINVILEKLPIDWTIQDRVFIIEMRKKYGKDHLRNINN